VQVTPPIANAMDGIIAATPSEQMKIERMRILISPNKLSTVNTAVATEVKAKANGPVGPDARSPGTLEAGRECYEPDKKPREKLPRGP
jgi:hypothetical protein